MLRVRAETVIENAPNLLKFFVVVHKKETSGKRRYFTHVLSAQHKVMKQFILSLFPS